MLSRFKILLAKNYVLILLIIFSFIINHAWLSFNYFVFSDYGYKSAETLADLINLTTWYTRGEFGNPDFLFWRTPVNLLLGVFGKLGFGLNVADKFLILWVWIIFSVTAPYLLVKYLTSSRLAGVVGALVFAFNTYFLSINSQGHFLISISACFGVLSLYYFLKFIESSKKVNLYLCIFSLFISLAYDLRVFVMFAGLYILYFVFFSIENFKAKDVKSKILGLSKNYFYIFIFLILLNLYWILPALASNAYIDNSVLNQSLFGEYFWQIKNAITLFHPFWNSGELNWFVINKIPNYYFLIPMLVILGIILNFKNKKIYFFILISFLGIFLSKQTNPPFGEIYKYLFDYLPGFSAFRESSKFYIYIALGYSTILGFLVSGLQRKKFNKLIILGTTILICAPFILNIKTVFTGSIGSMHEAREMPNDYLKLNKFISSQDEYFRVLYLPTSPKWLLFFDSNHPRISMYYSLDKNWKKFLESENFKTEEKMINFLLSKNSNNILDAYSIKYIVIPLEDEEKKDNMYQYFGNNRQYFIENLDRLKFLKKIDSGMKDLVVYENENYKQRLYLTENLEKINNSNNKYKELAYSSYLNSVFSLNLINSKQDLYLNFSDSYNKKWIAVVYNRDRLLIGKALPESNHRINEFGTNTYKIDAANLNDINGVTSISLIYLPNLLMLFGVIISTFSIFYLIILILKEEVN